MSEAAQSQPIKCPQCAAEARPGAKFCWLCGATIEPARHAPSSPRADATLAEVKTGKTTPATDSEKASPFQFGISTLLMILTLSAVLLGIWKMHPGLGALLTVVAAVGLIGLASSTHAAEKRGAPLTSGEKVSAFMRPVAATLTAIWAVVSVISVVALVVIATVIIGILQTCSAMCSPPGH
jgi:hypothetical protein